MAVAVDLEFDGGILERLHLLNQRLDTKILSPVGEQLPRWLAPFEATTSGSATSGWTLHTALSRTGVDVSLIVLWDGQGGHGPGGTETMVNLAKAPGVHSVDIPTASLVVPARVTQDGHD